MAQIAPLESRLEGVRQTLAERLPWSPLDFVPGISRSGDRAIYAEELTARVAAENDLRFVHEGSDGHQLGVFAQRLPWDSEFFGYGVARLDGVFPLSEPYDHLRTDFAPALEHLLGEARRRGIRYLFAMVDPRDLSLLRAFGQLGFTLIETRIHYHFSVQIVHYLRLPDHVPEGWTRFRQATPEDIPSLAQVAREMVNPYDRFHGDPFIDRTDVDRLMEKWVEQSVLGRFADLTVVPDVPNPRAFITYRYHKDRWSRWGMNLVQPVLSAVAPDHFGWFAVVGPELNQYLRAQGAQHCFGKTQITLGLDATVHFGKGEHVFRILL
ncbi:MAG: hypothetical protein K1X74_22035 [Pirellulales bacterium]|nr:hypothetical protein [Pirellulales bacterium]